MSPSTLAVLILMYRKEDQHLLRKKVEKPLSSEKKPKKKPSIETNDKQRKPNKEKNDKKMKPKGRPHITFTEDDSDTDEYPINRKSDNNKKKKKYTNVLESDSSASDVHPMLSLANKQNKINASLTLSSDDESDVESEMVRTLTKAEKKAKVFIPKTEDNVPNKKKEKAKDKKIKRDDNKDDARKKKKGRDGVFKNKVHKKSKENDLDAIKAEKREAIARVFGFSDDESNLSPPFPKEKEKKSVLGNLFEFEQDGSSSDLPELVVETTSTKTSFPRKIRS